MEVMEWFWGYLCAVEDDWLEKTTFKLFVVCTNKILVRKTLWNFFVVRDLLLTYLVVSLHKPLSGDRTSAVGRKMTRCHWIQDRKENRAVLPVYFGTWTFPENKHGGTQHPTATLISLMSSQNELRKKWKITVRKKTRWKRFANWKD